MDLYIDLLSKNRKKSLFKVIFGIVFLLLACGSIVVIILGKEPVYPFNWYFRLYYVIFAIGGVINIVEGLGYSFESFFGKAYILINSELISLKPSIFEKEQSVNWNEVNSIDYKLNKYEIEKIDNTVMILNLSKFDYVSINEIKKAINCVAKGKNVFTNDGNK